MLDYLIKFNATLLPHLLLITSTATKIFYEKKKNLNFYCSRIALILFNFLERVVVVARKKQTQQQLTS